MVEIREAIVVEGKYDRNTLLQIVKAPVIATDGFHIMKDKKLLGLLRRVAEQRGLIVFTDSDGAGFVIRNYLKSAIQPSFLKHAYIPDVPGKERRKSAPGKEGKLGVEGMRPEVILQALYRCGATVLGEGKNISSQQSITKQDLVDLGLSGGANSSQRRKMLLHKLDLPEHLSANALLDAVNLLCSRQEFASLCRGLVQEEDCFLERNHD